MTQYTLHAQDATGSIGEFTLVLGAQIIGRSKKVAVQIDTDLTSRQHAKLLVGNSGVQVFDLDSHNGVFINGTRIRKSDFKPGDALFLGGVKLILEADENAESAIDPESQLVWSRSQKAVNEQVALLERSGTDESLISDDPRLRNLALLHRVTERFAQTKSAAEFQREMMVLVRELTQAATVVLVLGEHEDQLKATAVLREGLSPSEEKPPVSWPLLRRVFQQGKALYTRDKAALKAFASDTWDPASEGAVLCVPVQKNEHSLGCIFVTRAFVDFGFEDREVESVIAVAQLLATRLNINDQNKQDDQQFSSTDDNLEKQFRRFHSGRQADRFLQLIQGGPFAEAGAESEEGAVLYLHLAGAGELIASGKKDLALQALETYFWVVQDRVEAEGGFIENILGTGFAAAFPGPYNQSALAALMAAVGTISQAWPPSFSNQLSIQAGLSTGPYLSGIVGHEKPVYVLLGHALTMATRVAEFAQNGQIVCTQDVQKAIGHDDAVQFGDLGLHALRGMQSPVGLFLADIPGSRGQQEAAS